MIKKTIALMVAAVATASLLTGCNMVAHPCEDDALTSSVVTGSKGGGRKSNSKVRLSKPKKHKSHSHPSGHHDFDCG